jgi:phosphatidylinositol glycan class B
VRRILVAGLLLHVAAAFFSLGYWHPDEHFQILEWMHRLEGRTDASLLSWEYTARLRSWLAPQLFFLLSRPLRCFGVESPFAIETVFRLLVSAFGLAATRACLRSFEKEIGERGMRFAVSVALLAGAAPFLHARISSEALSSAVFLWALAYRDRPAASGALAGLAFGFRFQSALLFAAFLAPSADKRGARHWLRFTGGLGVSLLGSAALDRVGYGEWSFPAWNYFRVNLLEGVAASFGEKPFWQYFADLATALPPLGLALLAAFIAFALRRPKHPLTWALVPFVLVHCAISHKELRFLTPLFWCAPLFAATFAEKWERLPRAAKIPILGLNAVYLLALGFQPARSEIPFLRWAWAEQPARLQILGDTRDPFEHAGLPLTFYRRPELETVKVAAADVGLVVSDRRDPPRPECRRVFRSTVLTEEIAARVKLRQTYVWDCP